MWTQIIHFNPDYAALKFAEDARRRARRRILVLQVPDNKADSVKLRAPCGFKCLRIYHKFNFTFWVKAQRDKMHDNYPIIHKNYFFRHLKCIIWVQMPEKRNYKLASCIVWVEDIKSWEEAKTCVICLALGGFINYLSKQPDNQKPETRHQIIR